MMAELSEHPMGYKRPPAIANVVISEEGTRSRFTLPSLTIGASDRAGNIELWTTARVFECARVIPSQSPEFFLNKMIFRASGKTVFIIMVDMEMESLFHSRFCKNGSVWPLDLSTELAGFGRTTMDYVSFIRDCKDNEKLASLKFKYAVVDMKTRKTVEIPLDIKESYGRFCKTDSVVEPYRPANKVPDAYYITVKIRPSDIDFNVHANHSVYIRLCIDSAAEACAKGKLNQFTGDFAMFVAKRMKALYLKECRLGDSLNIYCWEDQSKAFTLNFVVEKGADACFKSEMEFYS